MTIYTDLVIKTTAKVPEAINLDIDASIGDGPTEAAQGYTIEQKGTASQNAIQLAEYTEIVRAASRRIAVDTGPIVGASQRNIGGFDIFEADFRSHHHTNAAKRPSPYEHYRLVYRYGYDLGVDPRYCSAAWATVEQEARPRWEERNPRTWEAFKETIQYAWDRTRRQH